MLTNILNVEKVHYSCGGTGFDTGFVCVLCPPTTNGPARSGSLRVFQSAFLFFQMLKIMAGTVRPALFYIIAIAMIPHAMGLIHKCLFWIKTRGQRRLGTVTKVAPLPPPPPRTARRSRSIPGRAPLLLLAAHAIHPLNTKLVGVFSHTGAGSGRSTRHF
ncbi:hypothetical protein J6590_048489 [Homalodisca vitripennis]|nr:hypothetical protein J6590_048489 [Homalodisca vitripennis]